MTYKLYLAKYRTSEERDQAKRRFYDQNKDFLTGQSWEAGVSEYKNGKVETMLMNDISNDLLVRVVAPEESLPKLIESFKSAELFGTQIWEEK